LTAPKVPLLTAGVIDALLAAKASGAATLHCSLDLQRSQSEVHLHGDRWSCDDAFFPYPAVHKDRTIYYWHQGQFEPVARFGVALIKLVPTDWGPPTFEIDGIKMLPSEHVSPYEDARHKVGLIRPKGKIVLDCCGGLGYFASCCVAAGARKVISFEKSADVFWLRSINPWSPHPDDILTLTQADITAAIAQILDSSMDAVLHDPPRFGIAGELYSQTFYDHLYRVLKRKGRLFHYTGSPNKVARGRDIAAEVSTRLRHSGFEAVRHGDGLLAVKR
jgi:uncharacterized protein